MSNKNISLNYGILQTPYIFEKNHSLFGYDGSTIKNIGNNGENLTITIVSLNRSSLTIRAMNSIAEFILSFKGELLIIDNGSDEEQIANLKNAMLKMPYKNRIIELEKNYGPSGARNTAIKYVTTDWVLNLDNDIYFIINPLNEIQRTISELGCHFCNLPLLNETGSKIFALGGHLYSYNENSKVSVSCGTAYQQSDYNEDLKFTPFLSTFLFGGASVVNKNTFLTLGGYDEELFAFEDIDFSIRLFKQGLKIGNCGIFSLVHDHKKLSHESDINYEKKRFCEKTLKECAKYFHKKHDISVWTHGVSTWLTKRRTQLGLNMEENNTPIDITRNQDTNIKIQLRKKAKVALIIDSDSWAFANICKQLQLYLNDDFEFKIITFTEIDNVIKLLLLVQDCNLIHFFWRRQLTLLNFENVRAYANDLKVDHKKIYENFMENLNLSTSVYDHLFLDGPSLALNKEIYKLKPNYYVASKKLFDIYSNLPFCSKPLGVLEDGVDLKSFKPINIERLNSVYKRTVVIGWAGNSKWSDDIEDFKGVNSILKPAIEQLTEEGYDIETYFADRAEKMIAHSEMAGYYSKIDLYICTSKIEGTPNPILESMACGIPIISTDVGIVPQAFGEKQKEFILKERSIDCLKNAIKKLIDNPKLFLELSRENLDQIKEWDWSMKALKFKDFFNSCLMIDH